jgi:MurNAc alpha-1-phosphate uridylyltransferase
MRGMILAAGRGERMGNLTDEMPKPLLRAGNKYLIEYAIASLIKAGVREIVINISYQREKIKFALGDGARYGVAIQYSEEEERLETGGGILKALPYLGHEPFIVVSSDVIAGYALKNLPREPDGLAHLVLVDNPVFHLKGDFCLNGKYIDYSGSHLNTFTFANIGVYRPELFSGYSAEKIKLASILKPAIIQRQVTGEHFTGQWHNIGTIEQLNKFVLS